MGYGGLLKVRGAAAVNKVDRVYASTRVQGRAGGFRRVGIGGEGGGEEEEEEVIAVLWVFIDINCSHDANQKSGVILFHTVLVHEFQPQLTFS